MGSRTGGLGGQDEITSAAKAALILAVFVVAKATTHKHGGGSRRDCGTGSGATERRAFRRFAGGLTDGHGGASAGESRSLTAFGMTLNSLSGDQSRMDQA